jgi:autotransporter-associated beta strand protein
VLFGPVTDPNNANAASTTTLTGLGTLTVNNASAHFLVGFVNSVSTAVTVDMSGLANFNATVDIFGVGRKGTTTTARQQGGILRLSKNSSITANELSVGDTTKIDGTTSADNNGLSSTLYLGAGGSATTIINASTISMGIGKATGNMQFNTGVVSSDKVTIRGTSGGSSAVTNWNMAYRNMSSSSGTPGSTVNFGAGEVDAIIGNLNIARWGATGTGNNISPSATFSTGTNANSTIAVTTANIALNSTTNAPGTAQTMKGTLNVQGGVFSATTINLATGNNTTNLTRTATLNVDGGTFRFGTFGTPVGGYVINLNSGTVSSIDGTGRTLGLAYNLGKAGGGTTVAFGQASGGTGTIALNGAGTLLGNTTVEVVKDTTLGGAIDGAFSLTKTGAATLIINQNQNYSGGTIINEGTIKMSGNKTLASGSDMEVGASGTWNLDGTSQTLGELTGTGLVSSTWATSGFDTLTVGAGDATSIFGGTIAGGNGTSVRGINLTKTGAGTLTLSNANSYSGVTTVSAGTLLVNNTSGSGTGTGTVSVTSGATLGGTGTVGGAASITGIVAPGDSGIGTLKVTGNTTWKGVATTSANTNWKFDLAASGNTSDKLVITGDFLRDPTVGTKFYFDFAGSNPSFNTKYTLITWTGTNGFASFLGDFEFGGLSSSYNTNSTFSFSLDGKSLQFTAIPELSNILIGGLLGAGLLRRRRRA